MNVSLTPELERESQRRLKAACTRLRATWCEKDCACYSLAAIYLISKLHACERKSRLAWTSSIVGKLYPWTHHSPRYASESRPAVVHGDWRRPHPKGPAGSD